MFNNSNKSIKKLSIDSSNKLSNFNNNNNNNNKKNLFGKKIDSSMNLKKYKSQNSYNIIKKKNFLIETSAKERLNQKKNKIKNTIIQNKSKKKIHSIFQSVNKNLNYPKVENTNNNNNNVTIKTDINLNDEKKIQKNKKNNNKNLEIKIDNSAQNIETESNESSKSSLNENNNHNNYVRTEETPKNRISNYSNSQMSKNSENKNKNNFLNFLVFKLNDKKFYQTHFYCNSNINNNNNKINNKNNDDILNNTQKYINNKIQNIINNNKNISQKSSFSQKNLSSPLKSNTKKEKIEEIELKNKEKTEQNENKILDINSLHRKLLISAKKGDKDYFIEILSDIINHPLGNINYSDENNMTALHYATEEGNFKICEILIKANCNINCLTNNKKNCLHFSCKNGYFDITKLLYENKCKLNAFDNEKNTPLHYCIMGNHSELLLYLLNKKPNFDIKNIYGKTPFDYAKTKEIQKIINDYLNNNISNNNNNEINKNDFDDDDDNNKNSNFNENINNNNCNVQNNTNFISNYHHTNSNSNNINISVNTNSNKNIVKNIKGDNNKVNVLVKINIGTEKNHKISSEIKANNNNDTNQKLFSYKSKQEFHNQNIKNFVSKNLKNNNLNYSNSNHIKINNNNIKNNNNNENLNQKKTISPSDFICLGQIGKGSFGEVFLVKKIENSKLYAMKVLSKEKIFNQNLLKYALTERNVLSLSEHPFIVKLNYAFQTSSKLFLILDYCTNGDLSKHLYHEKRFSETRAKYYICEIILALEHLHKLNIIFRDLKPDNVVLDNEGHVKITDFGLCKEGIFDGNYTKSFCGSMAYLAPEMILKNGYSKCVDWYLLGILFYEMLFGNPPFLSDNKDDLFKNILEKDENEIFFPDYISKECQNFIKSLLTKNPEKRLGNLKDAIEIKNHPYFNDVNWNKVYYKNLPVPKYKIYDGKNFLYKQPRLFQNDDNVNKEKIEKNHINGWSFDANVE